jgi:hypothetical protein
MAVLEPKESVVYCARLELFTPWQTVSANALEEVP